MKLIDTRGLSCPQPLVLFHETINAENDSVDVLVDNDASCENVTRAAIKKGFSVNAKAEPDGVVRLELRK